METFTICDVFIGDVVLVLRLSKLHESWVAHNFIPSGQKGRFEQHLKTIFRVVHEKHYKCPGEIDTKDYSLDPQLFPLASRQHFAEFMSLETDLFASPNKKNCQILWTGDWEASAVDASQCPLESMEDL